MNRILYALDAEWLRMARSPAAVRAVRSWRESEPVLGVYRDPGEILEARRDPARAGVLLGSLARLAPRDDLAARTLLQAMVPGLVRLAGAVGEGPDAIGDVIALAWERIRTYPSHRQGSVAANILWDVRKRYHQHRRIDRPSEAPPEVAPLEPVRSPEDLVVEMDLLQQLDHVARLGLINDGELRAIVRTRVACDTVREAAVAERISPHCLTKRRWRGERSLRAVLDLAS